jgi:anti-sigma B factor antagonist
MRVVVHDTPSFGIALEPRRETVRIVVSGELDIVTAPELGREAQRLVCDGFERVVLDLRSVTFVDSRGLRAILGTRHEAMARGAELALVRGGDAAERLFEVAGVIGALQFVEPGAIG